MKLPPLYLSYIYSYKDIDNPKYYHQIEISNFFEKNSTLSKDDLIFLLENDGAYFYKDSIRYYDSQSENFKKLPEDFSYEFNYDIPEFELIFCIKNRNASFNKTKVDYLEKEVVILKSQIHSLIERIKILEDKQQIHVITDQDDPIYPVPRPPRLKKNLDIVIMYSDPLVRRKKEKKKIVTQLSDPVDFENECNSLRKMLENRKIKLRIEIATLKNLTEIISNQPTILHFICHGDYSSKRQRFYLAFENDCGELDKCDSERIKKLLKDGNYRDIKIVFVNACHSEEVGRVFLEAGIPCVIAVQSELKIEDKIAQSFAENFYREIFSERTIKDAFANAINQVQAINDRNVYTCCCAHSHSSNCQWHQNALDEGYELAHNKHTHTCNCERAAEHFHRSDCSWTKVFFSEFGDNNDEDEDERGGGEDIFVCCCRKNEKEKFQHNETLKFSIMFKNPTETGNYTIFEDVKQGNLEEIGKLEPYFPNIKLFGRNELMNRLFLLIKSKNVRFVQVSGDSGVGKTDFVRQTANYIYERRNTVDEIKYENLEGLNSFTTLVTRIRGICPNDEKYFAIYKSKRILYILDNSDSLIKSCGNKKLIYDYFKKIADNTINIKFIIITLSIQKLDIGESNINLGPLDQINGAKLLLLHIKEQLPCKYRNPLILAEHYVVKNMKRTPKDLLLFARYFQANPDLEDLEFKMKGNTLYGVNKFESDFNSIEGALKELQDRNHEAYDFLIFLAQFPAGLLFDDLYTLSKDNYIPENWLDLLKILTVERKKGMKEEERGSNLQLSRRASLENDRANNENSSIIIPPNDYFWIKIEKNSKDNKLFLKVEHYLIKTIKEQIRNFNIEIKAVDFISHLSKILIKQLKQEKRYFEKIIECSAVCDEGIWTSENRLNKEEFKHEEISTFTRTLHKSATVRIEESQSYSCTKMLEIHKINFYDALNQEDAKLILTNIENNEEVKKKYIRILETLCENIPTIFKMIGNITEAIELADIAMPLCKLLQENSKDPILKRLEVKIHLMITSLYYYESFSGNRDETKIDSLDEHLKRIQNLYDENDELTNLIEAEKKLIELWSHYEKDCRKILTKSSQSGKSGNKKKLQNSLEEIKEESKALRKLFNDKKWKSKYPILYHKFVLLECEIISDLENIEINKLFLEEMKNACQIFQEKDSFYLELIANKALSKYIIRASNPFEKLLYEAKNKYCQRALALASKIKDKNQEYESKILLDQIHDKIRISYSHVLIFMRAAPLVEIIDKNEKKEIANMGFRFYIPSNFRKEIQEKLKETNVKLSLKFETLTKKNFMDTLKQGSKIIQINVEYNENNLVLENESGCAEKIPLNELEELIKKEIQEDVYIEILIICCQKGEKLAEIFSKIKIKYIIFFEFKINEEEENLIKFIQDICMNEFSINFLEEICKKSTFDKSYNHAEEIMMRTVFKKYRNLINDKKTFQNILGHGPKVFNSEKIDPENIFEFVEGILDDISSAKAPSNIAKPEDLWIGRKLDMYEIMRVITQEKKCIINIYGKKNIGKTTFSKLVGYYMYSRLFFKHGVFFFSLKNLEKFRYDLIELMKEELGEEFAKYHSYFKNKSILLIFDDYDELIKLGKKVLLEKHVFDSLKEDKIPYILISNKVIKQYDSNIYKHELKSFSEADCLDFLEFEFNKKIAESQDVFINIDWNKMEENKKDKFQAIIKETKRQPKKMMIELNKFCNELFPRKKQIGSPSKRLKKIPLKKDISVPNFNRKERKRNLNEIEEENDPINKIDVTRTKSYAIQRYETEEYDEDKKASTNNSCLQIVDESRISSSSSEESLSEHFESLNGERIEKNSDDIERNLIKDIDIKKTLSLYENTNNSEEEEKIQSSFNEIKKKKSIGSKKSGRHYDRFSKKNKKKNI